MLHTIENDSIELIVGLGNPGLQYSMTRHNAGAMWIEELCNQFDLRLSPDRKFNSHFLQCRLFDKIIKLQIPMSYMNLSGQAVSFIAKYYNIKPQNILILHDELDLDPGFIRLKFGGGHGGHNGLRDIINHLNTKDFYRLRLGIGHPGHKDEVSDYVLNKPSKNESLLIDDCIQASIKMLPAILEGQFDKVMNELNSYSA
ncbi:MAG: peptidyl-tRNA hydrolase [Francisellaceae bacterium]|nr:peptidyl-tRNA hydrolase [Francisellaceae bacterium]